MKNFFIAEIGVNHLGDFTKAIRMVKQAKEAGFTAVKFQKYDPVKVLGKDSPYLKDAHQLRWSELFELSKFARRLGLQFGCSIFDVADLAVIGPISDFHKVATRMNGDREFIKALVETKVPVYMSIQAYHQQSPLYNINYMWCVAQYPSKMWDCLNHIFDERHGISSHCPDPNILTEAYTRGARTFEVHVKENPEDMGCDMASSLTFNDCKNQIDQITNRTAILGN